MNNSNTNSSQTLNLELETSKLNEQQIRLVKRVNALMAEVLTSEYEDEYFDVSQQLFKIVAMVVKSSSFNDNKGEIAFDQQVLEFCADALSDQVYQNEISSYDN